MNRDEIAALRAELEEQAELTKIIAMVALGAVRELERLALETGRPSPVDRMLASTDDVDPMKGVTGPDTLASKERIREGLTSLLQLTKKTAAALHRDG